MKGVCLRVINNFKPKKPNSAERKVAKVRLSSGRAVSCRIPGEGGLSVFFSIALVVGGWESRRTGSGRVGRWGSFRGVRVFDDRIPWLIWL